MCPDAVRLTVHSQQPRYTTHVCTTNNAGRPTRVSLPHCLSRPPPPKLRATGHARYLRGSGLHLFVERLIGPVVQLHTLCQQPNGVCVNPESYPVRLVAIPAAPASPSVRRLPLPDSAASGLCGVCIWAGHAWRHAARTAAGSAGWPTRCGCAATSSSYRRGSRGSRRRAVGG